MNLNRWLLGACLALIALAPAHAAALRFCDRQTQLTAHQEDQLFRFGAVIKSELDKSGESVALIARSGLNLARFGVRYSHGGLTLKASPNAPWSVRQLYYACDEGKPRLFDQGMSGFLLGTDDPTIGYISVVLLPPPQAGAAEAAGLDNRRALALLGGTYSANAYAFGRRYQNCNQWLAELLATAWSASDAPAPVDADAPADVRQRAQEWLRDQGYAPTAMVVGALMPLALFIPYLHSDDHPPDDLAAGRFRVAMPAALEDFVRATMPGATRLEFCHTADRMVLHRGWEPVADGCVPGPQDTVLPLD